MKLIHYKYPTTTDSNSLSRLFSFGTPSFERFETFFDEFLEAKSHKDQLASDLYEDDKNYFVRLELPGIDKNEVNLELENSVLTCSGHHSEKTENGKAEYSFKSSIPVPEGAASEDVSASYKDGVLIVTLPKREVSIPRQIKVK